MAEPSPLSSPDQSGNQHKDDFDAWSDELKQPDPGRVDLEALKTASGVEQHAMVQKALDGITKVTENQSEADKAGTEITEELNVRTAYMRNEIGLHEKQTQALQEQLDSENPADVFAGRAEMRLNEAMETADDGTLMVLSTDYDGRGEPVRAGIKAFFERMGQPDPLAVLDKPVLGRFTGRDKHKSTQVDVPLTINGKPGRIQAIRSWDESGSYYYMLSGGPVTPDQADGSKQA